jgi:hypothetical protein
VLKHKKEPTRNGSSVVGMDMNTTSSLTHATEFVKDDDTWSDALEYWCRRENDELPDLD